MVVRRKMLKFISILCLQIVLLVSCSSVFAKSTDSTSIRIMVEHKKQIMMRGSVIESATKKIELGDIKKQNRIYLGSFGLSSQVASNCDIGFKTKNNFRLKQLDKPNSYLAKYKIAYDGKVINPAGAVHTACNFSAKNLSLVSFDMLSPVNASGLYQDTITVLVTVP